MLVPKQAINYYEVLEVPPDAPQHEVHKAYTRAKATYAQDNPALYSMFTRDEARDLLKLIEEAYAVLGNHGLRRNYDESLLKSGTHQTAPVLASVPPLHGESMPGFDHTNDQTADHNALPDFVVPDPSIPGSYEASAYGSSPAPVAPGPSSNTSTPPAPTRESVLVANSEFTVRKRETVPPLMPADTGRCPLGTYKIDDAFEREIAERTEFDGPFLQRVRTYKQVTLEKLSVASRIGKTYLIALESNDFKNLPAPVFLRGFLVQMAKQLGLDDAKVQASYMALARASEKYSKKYGP